MFIHHVYFWLKNPGNDADLQALKKGLESLTRIETIGMYQIGTPASTNRDVIDRSYSVSWMLVFDNLEDEEIYQEHPDHKKFVADCSHLWEKVVVYDSIDE
ncbi:MAG: Dabb family protein [Gemmatimonadaceae bacterium]|nr:Dabb family protein [Chitinophagaceae bacterium]